MKLAKIFQLILDGDPDRFFSIVSSITAIKDKYQLKKNWMGDPCVPNKFLWDGLSCTYAASSPQSVTGW